MAEQIRLLHPPKTYNHWRARVNSYLMQRLAVGLDDLDVDIAGYWHEGWSAGETARDLIQDLTIDMTPTGEYAEGAET